VRPALQPIALAIALAAFPGLASAAPPACRGTISGAVTARFDCVVVVAPGEDGRTYLTIAPTTPVEDIPSLAPGSFDVTDVLRRGTWKLDDLGMGKASLAAQGGTLFTATKTTGQRGEVRLTWKSVKKRKDGTWEVSGSYRARLLPAGAGKTGEVVVEVEFGGAKG
jgi:hypothetical protein